METAYADSWPDMAQSCDIDLWVMKWRSAWPIFHGPAILLCILKTIWCMNIIIWDYESVWRDVWPQSNFRSVWPIFHGPVKTIWCMNNTLPDYGSVWPNIWPKNKCRSLWPIFHGPVIYLISWRLFVVCTSYFGIMKQYDAIFDLKTDIGHCDFYFMVQWFCLVSGRLFDMWTSLFRIMIQYDPTFDLKINVGHCVLYFMIKCFALYLKDYLMYEHHYLGL